MVSWCQIATILSQEIFMATSASPETKARITARVPTSVQSVLEEAAAYMGVPLNSFLVSAAVEKAGEVLAAERIIRLSRRDAEFFASVMENPPGPNQALRKAAQTYRNTIRE
jgi:uncharacterized protein (DUF1778 family)